MFLNLFNFKGNVSPGPQRQAAFVHWQYGPGKIGIYSPFNTDTSMVVLGHVAFTLHLSKTHHLVIHAGIVAKLPAGIDFIFGMPSLRSLGTVIDTRHSDNIPYGFVCFHEVGAVIVPIVR